MCHEQPAMKPEQFRQHNVPHIPNGEHGLAGGDAELIDRAYTQALAFVVWRTGRGSSRASEKARETGLCKNPRCVSCHPAVNGRG
jgi:hypothetical protein